MHSRDPASDLFWDIHETAGTVLWARACVAAGLAGVLLGFCWGAGL